MKLFSRNLIYYFFFCLRKLLLILLIFTLFQGMALQEGAEMGLSPYETWMQIVQYDVGLHVDASVYRLPSVWFLLHFLPVWLFSDAFWKDYQANGCQLLLQSGSKRLYFMVGLGSICTLCIAFHGTLVLVLSVLALIKGGGVSGWMPFLRIHFFLTIENIVLLMAVLYLSLWVLYRVGLIVVFLWLGMVSLIPSPFLLGSGSLVFRQDFLGPEGYSFPLNLVVCALYLFVVIILYYRRTKNVDVL